MSERMFVLMEVEVGFHGHNNSSGRTHFIPADTESPPEAEEMWLKPERIIPESRLLIDWDGLCALILDPEPEEKKYHCADCEAAARTFSAMRIPEKDEWKEWVEQFPKLFDDDFHDHLDVVRELIMNWLKRMPRERR